MTNKIPLSACFQARFMTLKHASIFPQAGYTREQVATTNTAYATRVLALLYPMVKITPMYMLNSPGRRVTFLTAAMLCCPPLRRLTRDAHELTLQWILSVKLRQVNLSRREATNLSAAAAVNTLLLVERNTWVGERVKEWRAFTATMRRTHVLTSYEWRQNTKVMRLRLRQNTCSRWTSQRPVWQHINLFNGDTLSGSRTPLKYPKSRTATISLLMPAPYVGCMVMSLQRYARRSKTT